MGDRANVYVHDGDEAGVFLYTHGGGSDLPEVVAQALEKKWRWDDVQYLTRIVFDVMTHGYQGGETSFGISAVLGDNSYPIICLDVSREKVSMRPEWKCLRLTDPDPLPKPLEEWSFEEFVKDRPGWSR